MVKETKTEEVLTAENVRAIRPGLGLHPNTISVNAKTRFAIEEYTTLKKRDR